MPDAVRKFVNDVAGGFFGNDYLRDFTHASKTFRSKLYGNAPKFKFLFHVYFNINTSFLTLRDNGGAQVRDQNFGILVKSIKLPSYTFATHELNQYNRKRIVQTKIKYDPIDITFHDDNDNFITSLWYRYYTYYYGDAINSKVAFSGSRGGQPPQQQKGGGNKSPATGYMYDPRTQYSDKISDPGSWGYIGENNNSAQATLSKPPFFNNITVYGFNRHDWISYTLVNPIITRFGHDTYNYDESAGIMSNVMSVDYETVLYNQGNLDGEKSENVVTGFGSPANYDKRLSPISTPGSNSNVLGKFGLVNSAGGAVNDLLAGNVIGGVKTAGAVYNGFKNINLKQTLKAEVTTALQNSLQGTDNNKRNNLFVIPKYGATPSNIGTAGAPGPGTTNTQTGSRPTAGTQNT